MRLSIAWCLTVALGLMAFVAINNDYMTQKRYEITVLHKVVERGSKGREYPVFVYQLADGYVFDRSVSWSTYTTTREGDKYAIMLRPFDVKQTAGQNALYFFGPVILGSIAITSLLFVMFYTLVHLSERRTGSED